MSKNCQYALFSRDDRTFYLFRSTWVYALNKIYPTIIHNRNFGIFNAVRSVIFFIYTFRKTRLVFGTSEILLYYIFSSSRDVLIFTGLGRIFIGGGYVSKFAIYYLKLFYRNQKIVVLNVDDKNFFDRTFGSRLRVYILNGEGYQFPDNPIAHQRSNKHVKICVASRLLYSKRIDAIIDSCSELKIPYTVDIYGDFDYRNKDAIKFSPVEVERLKTKSIYFKGFKKNIRETMAGYDFYISMSKREGLSFATLDAISSGCILLLSEVPGHNELNGFDGVYFCTPADIKLIITDYHYHPDKFLFDSCSRLANASRKFGTEKIHHDILKIMKS